MTLLRRRLFNGCDHALLVEYDTRSQPVQARLLRKRDNAGLLLILFCAHQAPAFSRECARLSRAAHQELGQLLRQSRRPGANPTRPTVIDRDRTAALGVTHERLAGYRPLRQREPAELVQAGFDRYARPLWLTSAAARAWQRMADAARSDGIDLEPVSGFRSAAYQAALIARKRSRGQSWDDILAVSALPGFSEHHLGTTLDLHAGNGAVLEESFESTDAFAWLRVNARRFGFRLSYPRDNPHGIAYEPWHWRYHDPAAG